VYERSRVRAYQIFQQGWKQFVTGTAATSMKIN